MEPKGYSALGTTVMMFGGPIITASRTNNDVHIHSFASELEAIEQTMEETIQFQELIEDLHPQLIPINLYNDNKALEMEKEQNHLKYITSGQNF